MRQPTDCSIRLNGLRFHYLTWGQAASPPLFLLHGLGSNAHAWDRFAPAVAHRYHVIALDQRGHGDTDWAPDGYDSEKQADDFASFADALGARRFTLLGHSMGGINAMLYAGAHPERLERLVIVDIGPEINTAGANRIRSQLGPEVFDSVEEVYLLVRSQSPVPPDDMLRERARHAAKQLPDGRWTWKYDRALRSPGASWRRPAPENLWHILAAVPCPTLVVRGQDSDLLTHPVAERMAATLPYGRLVEVAGAGHRVPLDNAAGFERAVREFLAV